MKTLAITVNPTFLTHGLLIIKTVFIQEKWLSPVRTESLWHFRLSSYIPAPSSWWLIALQLRYLWRPAAFKPHGAGGVGWGRWIGLTSPKPFFWRIICAWFCLEALWKAPISELAFIRHCRSSPTHKELGKNNQSYSLVIIAATCINERLTEAPTTQGFKTVHSDYLLFWRLKSDTSPLSEGTKLWAELPSLWRL